MNTLKRHAALIAPLLALLFSLQSMLFINRAIHIKEDKLLQSYFILIASKQALQLEDLRAQNSKISTLAALDPDPLLQKFQDFNNEETIKTLQNSLPFFYSIKLQHYPNQRELKSIESSLKELDYITHIETFSKTHNQVYKLLYFTKANILIFASLLGIFSLLLMMRQIQVWRFQHQKRMQIMALLGASSWLRNKILFKLAFFDSILASIIIAAGSYYFSTNPTIQELFNALGIQGSIFDPLHDFALLTGVAIGVSLFSVIFVIISQRKI